MSTLDNFRRRGFQFARIDFAGRCRQLTKIAFRRRSDFQYSECGNRNPSLQCAEAPQTLNLAHLPHAQAQQFQAMPRAVKMPSAAIIPRKSSGDVSTRTRSTFSPLCAASTARSALK